MGGTVTWFLNAGLTIQSVTPAAQLITGGSTTVYAVINHGTACPSVPEPVQLIIQQPITPTFTPLGPYCQGATPAALPTTSINGIAGTWNPAAISTASSGTATYTFTPNVGQCATPFSMIIAVQASATATFDPIGPLCVGDTPPALPATSTNNITGTWNPATISTAAPGTVTYTFTPDAGGCGTGTTLDVTVNSGATPTFTQLGPYCQGDMPAALPTTSNNGISGTWNPATISTAATGNTVYTFTPNAGQCASAQTMTVTVNSNTTPTFTQLGPYCQGDTPAALPTTSNNGISGTWNPAAISTAMFGIVVYTFTPSAGQCATGQTMTVTVNPGAPPIFTQLGPYCQGDTPAALPTTSNNGISGTWNPAAINTAMPGVVVYTFMPNAGQCAVSQTMTVTVDPSATPAFTQLGPYCIGQTPDPLPTTSLNGVNGTWNPAVINTVSPGVLTYTFTPTGQCAGTQTMLVTVNAPPVANTPGPLQFCVLFIPPTLLSENSATVLNQITGGNPGLTVNWFFDAAATMPILNINSIFSIIPPPTTVYANVFDGLCSSATVPVNVVITLPPVLNNPGPQSACQSYTLPPITGLNLPGNQAYYTGPNGTGTPLQPGQTITATTTLFIYAGSGNCFDQEQFTITITPPPTANPAGPLQVCDNGAGLGQFNLSSVNATISGGAGTVSWFTNAGATNPIANPAAFVSGSTTVYATVTAGGCTSAPLPVMLQLIPAPVANPAGPLQLCDNGAGIGVFQLTMLNGVISGGFGIVSWFTNPAATIPVPNPDGHISGNATVYAVVSNGGCVSQPTPIVLELLPVPIANTPVVPLQACVSVPPNAIFNLNDFDLIISGGTGTVNWFSNAGGSIPINNPGSYASSTGTVYAVVSNGVCNSQPVPVVLQANPLPVVTLTVAQSISCASAPDGAINTAVSGVPGPYTFDWSFNPIDGIQNPDGLAAGNYSVVVTATTTGCAGTANITLTQPSPLVSVCTQGSPVSAPGGNDGVGSVTVSGGTPGYAVAWSGPQSGSQILAAPGVSSIANLQTGTYSVTVTDANNCVQTCTFVIGLPGCGIILDIVGTNLVCNNDSTGAISLTVNNATGSLNFNWNIDSLDGIQNPTGLPAGVYSVIVTDALGCTATAADTLTQPSPIVVVCNEQNPASSAGAADGSATVIVGGGTPGYTVIWSGPLSDTIVVPAADTLTIANLTVGVYTIMITDANGCESICTFTIQDSSTCNLQLTIAATGPICSGDTDGAITLTVTGATGPLNFDWNDDSLDGQQNPAGLAPGFYSVVVTDSVGCADAISITLADPAPLSLMCAQENPVSAPGANDGSASITISGGVPGYLVEWSDGLNTAMFNVAAPGTVSLTGLAGGDYFVLITDANGCQAFCQFTIDEPIICDITFNVTVTNPTCNGSADGAIIADVAGATGNLTVVWNISALDGDLKPDGLSGGTYSVTVTDENNCSASTTIIVNEPDPILLICSQLNPASSDSSADGAATITISGGVPGYILIWDGLASGSLMAGQPGDYTINNLPAGDYTLTLRDAGECVVTCQFTIEKPSCDIALLISGVNPLCNGSADGSITLNVTGTTGGFFPDWSDDNLDGIENPTGLTAGIYSVTITDQEGCESTNSIVLIEPGAVVLVCAQEVPLSMVGANDGRGIVIISGGTPGYAVNWSGPISGSTVLPDADTLRIPALPPGTYAVTATDANGCEVNCTFVIEDIFCGLNVSVDATNPACLGSNTGSILLSIDNAYGSVSFDWNDNTLDGQQNPSGLGAGTYVVVVTDSLGCALPATIILTEPTAIALVCAQQNPVSAVGADDGSATVQVSGGTPGYTVSWSGPANGAQMLADTGTLNISNLPEGTYTVIVTDANGCEQTCSFIITPPCAITADISGTDPVCNGSSDGAINLTVNNGLGNLTFDWNDNTLDGIQSPTGLPAGTYDVVVTDSTGCTATATVTLTDPGAIVLVCAEQNQVSTIGGNDGSATVQISGGTAGYTVAWSGAASGSQSQVAAGTATITDLLAGNYTVTVTDANGCEAICTFTIGTVGCNFTLDITALNPACNGEDNGIIFVILNGGTPGFSFDWNVDALDGIQDPSGLSAGDYAVTVTDGIGCVATTSITLVDPPVLTLACAQQNPASTIGGNDGSGAVTITGGVAVYNVNYTGPLSGDETADAEGTTILDNLLPGTYNIEVTDSNGCVETCSFTIGDPSCSLALNIAGTNPLCDGDDNGSISLTVNNATGNLTFDWNVDALDGIQNPSGLTAGTYSVTVTDDGGCSVNTSVTLNAPAAIALVCAQQNPVSTVGGNDGTATVQISGGTAGYTVAWSGAASGSQNETMAGTATITGLIAGDYTVIVTDANGCETTCTFTVEGPNCNIGLNMAGTNPLCNGDDNGSISLTVNNATGNLTFDWNDDALDGIQNPSGLAAGAYSVTVTDGAGCTADATVTLSDPVLLEIVCTQQSPVSTPGGNEGSAGVQISGGTAPYTVAWSGPLSGSQNQTAAGTVTIPDLSAGNYTIVVTDANGCEATCTLTFADPSCNLTFTIVGTDPTCNGSLDGSIELTLSGVNGNATFEWSNPALNGIQNPGGLPAGAYSVVVTDDAGCSATDAVVLVNPAALALVCAQQNPVSTVGGSDGSATVQISGGTAGYTVAWSGAASGSQNQPAAGTATITGLIAGNYTVVVTDANGCEATCTFTIVEPVCNLNLNITGTDPLCNGGNTGSINLAVNGAIGTPTFDWNDNSLDGIQNPTGLTAGIYSVIVTDGAGCTANASVTLSAPAAIVLVCAQQNPVSTVGGNDGSATVQISGGTAGYTVAWSGAASGSQNQPAAGTATITGLIAGNYTIIVTDANGCTSTCSFVIGDHNCDLSLNISGTDPLCNGGSTGSISLAVNNSTGNLTFDWNNNSLDGIQNPTGLPAGTYSVIVTDGAGCTANASVTLSDPAALTFTASGTGPDCFDTDDGFITIESIAGGVPPYEYSIQGGIFTAVGAFPLTRPGLTPGAYTVLVRDANGCIVQSNVNINSLQAYTLDLGPDLFVELGDSIRLEGLANFDIDSVVWTPQRFLSDPSNPATFVRPTETTGYLLTAFDINGCKAEDDIIVYVQRVLNVFVPNAFSPNDDGINDVLTVFADDKITQVKSFRIFDRWGNMLFFNGPFPPNDLQYGWDGEFNGRPMNAGVYVFAAEVEYVDGRIELIKGEVMLMR
ncbi:MAG: gliding motility-associated C-terminal domain-containing protein [Saprospiraceae bacterium]|nr:gliding motility-associated C-terminal domain-containing protein [Saprospiraceae bacterium]